MAAPPVTNLDFFVKSLNDSMDQMEDDYGEHLMHVVFVAIEKFVERTPVLTGRARAGWRASAEKPVYQGGGRKRRGLLLDPNGGATIAAALNAIAPKVAANPFTDVFIQNNVPYIEILENGRHTLGGRTVGSLQSPQPGAIFSLTVAELKEQFE